MILTEEYIEKAVWECGGTWVKRRNLRRRLIKNSNDSVNDEIERLRLLVRKRKAHGAREGDLREDYKKISQLSRRLHDL